MTRAKNIEKECGTCGAVPFEPCRSLRQTGPAEYGHGRSTTGSPGQHAHIKTLHPWRGHRYDNEGE